MVGAAAAPVTYSKAPTDDAALVRRLPGFTNHTANVNGTTLHYVMGGKGAPLVLLPGWPQTWWEFNKIMPKLAEHYTVIAVDIRGQGSSAKPAGGYDKKTMAEDVKQLIGQLGYDKAFVAGHDIGSQVAWALAANHPEVVQKLVMMDVPHSDVSLFQWPIVPTTTTFGASEKIDEKAPFPWWFAFHQVKGLPEKLLAGREHLEQEWIFTYLMKDESVLSSFDRAVYANAYKTPAAIRAGNAWYQSFTQDIADQKTYAKVAVPVLGIAGPGYGWLNGFLSTYATDARTVKINSGHFMAEEAPAETLSQLETFLK
ncbi:alpha/beta hydrolase [Oxalobacteraceae bacterium OM1]|nr:alpha/beta hydrolase [Oxalobacteraceae bacterium OM1]